MRRFSAILVLAVVLLAGGLGYVAGNAHMFTPQRAVAADECQLFSETGKQICGRFLEYWRANGGLAQQGLPLSDPFDERSDVNGQTYRVQYFERAVFELHTENQRPNDVLLSLLGREKFAQRYPGGLPTGNELPLAAGQTFVVAGPSSSRSNTFRVTITGVSEGMSLPNSSTKPKGRFVIVTVRYTNLGNEPEYLGDAFGLKDERGRRFTPAASAYGTVQPGLEDTASIAFDVPGDATRFTVVPRTQ